MPTELNLQNSLDSAQARVEMIKSHSKNMLPDSRKDKRISSSSPERTRHRLQFLLSLNHSKRRDMKSSIWLTPLMNTSFNNWKSLMERNSRIAQRKDLILIKLKMKRSHLKNKRHLMKDFANSSRKFLETKLKRSNLVKDWKNLLVY